MHLWPGAGAPGGLPGRAGAGAGARRRRRRRCAGDKNAGENARERNQKQWLRFPYVSLRFIVGSTHGSIGGGAQAFTTADGVAVSQDDVAQARALAAALQVPARVPRSEPKQ